MHRSLFILAVFIRMAVSGQEAHAARCGTRDNYQHLQDLNEKGPNGEALSLGYVNIFHRLPQEKIEPMQRAGALPNPLPPYRHTIFDYLWGLYLVVVYSVDHCLRGVLPDARNRLPHARCDPIGLVGGLAFFFRGTSRSAIMRSIRASFSRDGRIGRSRPALRRRRSSFRRNSL